MKTVPSQPVEGRSGPRCLVEIMMMMKVNLIMMMIMKAVFSFGKTLSFNTNLPIVVYALWSIFWFSWIYALCCPAPPCECQPSPRTAEKCSTLASLVPTPPNILILMIMKIITVLLMYKILMGGHHWLCLLSYHSDVWPLPYPRSENPIRHCQATRSNFIISSILYFNDGFRCDVNSSE